MNSSKKATEIIAQMLADLKAGEYNTGVTGTTSDGIHSVSVDGNMNVSIPYETAQNYDAISLSIKHILIEPLFFNDFYVAVYDENNNLLLDKKYFTKSLLSAKITAYEISKEDFCKDFPIYICTKNPIDNTINYEKIVLKYKNEDTPETTD